MKKLQNKIKELQESMSDLVIFAYAEGQKDALANMSIARKANGACGFPLKSWAGKKLCKFQAQPNGRCKVHQWIKIKKVKSECI